MGQGLAQGGCAMSIVQLEAQWEPVDGAPSGEALFHTGDHNCISQPTDQVCDSHNHLELFASA